MLRWPSIVLVLVCSISTAGCRDVWTMRQNRDIAGLTEALQSREPAYRVKVANALGRTGD